MFLREKEGKENKEEIYPKILSNRFIIIFL